MKTIHLCPDDLDCPSVINDAATFALQHFTVIVREVNDDDTLTLSLSPHQDVQGFVVLLKKKLPTIR